MKDIMTTCNLLLRFSKFTLNIKIYEEFVRFFSKLVWRDENGRDGKGRKENRGENVVFPCLVQERKQEGNKTKWKKIT